MMIFGFLADEKGLKLDQIPPKVYLGIIITDLYPQRVNLKKWFFGFLADEKGLKLDPNT